MDSDLILKLMELNWSVARPLTSLCKRSLFKEFSYKIRSTSPLTEVILRSEATNSPFSA